jgi:hypothetical protein
MAYSIFADESGTHDKMKCYTIGALVLPTDKLSRFEAWFEGLKKKHGVPYEVKWTRVANSHGLINLGIELLTGLLRVGCKMGFIVVKKEPYNKWQEDKEDGFYVTYTLLIHDQMQASQFPHEIFIDDKSDEYPKQDELMQIVVNNMLKQIQSRAVLTSVKKTDSKLLAGIQAIDLVTGAINTSHNLYLDPDWKMQYGKRVLIKKFSEIIGWDNLCYDTYPKNKPNPNIWHFPWKEYRGKPKSEHIKYNWKVDFIKPNDLLEP